MAEYTQLPGTLNLSAKSGDELATQLDFSIAMTGYTVSASVYSLVTGSTVDTFTTSFVSAADGTVNIALSETQTSALGHGTYGWRFQWIAPGTVTRTALEGMLEVK